MKKINAFFCLCLFAGQVFPQQRQQDTDPLLFRTFTHSGKLKSTANPYQGKSFYKSKADWQTIIDTTWGPGRPLNEKLTVFDAYTEALTKYYDGFNDLAIDPTDWDSIKVYYRSKINSSTSKGAFAALIGHLIYNLHDYHAYALDTTVVFTPLKPGVPILLIGAFVVNHFGAVLTVLPDSSLLVLRVIDDHPLGLQPGDIVLGYEGIPWKVLVDELLASGIPILFWQRSAKSASRYNELASAGLNWHLFDTIDIVKYVSGDTVHLSVYPLSDLPAVPLGTPPAFERNWFGKKNLFCNNEQLPVPGVSFLDPDKFDKQSVSYDIIEGTNIGYIYLCAEIYPGVLGLNYNTDDQFYEAVKSLFETEGLIIDIRFNYGGWSLFDKALSLLNNKSNPTPTIKYAVRCNPTDFGLCPNIDQPDFSIRGNPMSWYDNPVAILAGPNCVSDGDITAYRFSYLPMTRFFGKSTCAALGLTQKVSTYPEWFFYYSYENPFRVNDPDVYLNHKEFPIDEYVWFDSESVAAGKDAVVEKAMDWIRNLSYAHNVKVNPGYVTPGTGTATITAEVENPGSHDLSVYSCITSVDSAITDSVYLYDDGNHNDGDPGDGTWGTIWSIPDMRTTFSADMITEDITAGTSRTIAEAVRFTTIGPVVLDEITYNGSEILNNGIQNIYFKVALRNNDLKTSATKVNAQLTCLDTNLAEIILDNIEFDDIAPGEISTSLNSYCISIPMDCPINTLIPVKVDICGDYYTFFCDTFSVMVRAPLIMVNPTYADAGTDTITVTSQIIKPNGHDLSVSAYITSKDQVITDTVSLFDDGNHNDSSPGDGIWGAFWSVPAMKTTFAIDISAKDFTDGTIQSITGIGKFTTIGPVVVDGITYTKSVIYQNCDEQLYFKVALRNNDLTESAVNVQAKLTSLDSLADIPEGNVSFPNIAPGEISTSSIPYFITISEDCPVNKTIPVKVDISSNLYTFWTDTFSVEVRALQIAAENNTICDGKQTNIDIRNVLASDQSIYYTYTSNPDNIGAVTGNTSNFTGVWEKYNIKDNLDNITDQAQRVVYTVTPYLFKNDKTIGCPGASITVDVLVEPTVEITATANDDTIQNEGRTNIVVSSIQEPTLGVYYTYTSAPENAGAVTGNTSNTTGVPISLNINDTLYNTTGQTQKVVYTITPYILKSDGSIGCIGTPIIVDLWEVTDVEDISIPIARIYPNPAENLVNIEISNTGGQETEIELLTVTGHVIYRKDIHGSRDHFTEKIDLSGYARGLYFVQVRQSGAVYNGKIIVQ